MSEDFSFAKFADNDFYKKQNENLVDLADLVFFDFGIIY